MHTISVLLPLAFFGVAFATGDFVNIALNMPVYAHSTWDENSIPSHATDGLASGDWGADLSCSATQNVDNPWFVVDLLEPKAVTEVRIKIQSDCCAGHFQKVSIRVGDSFNPSQPSAINENDFEVCGAVDAIQPLNSDVIVTCPSAITGRFVGIFRHSKGHLTVCEIMVAGTGGHLVAITDHVTPFASSTYDLNMFSNNAFDNSGRDYYKFKSCMATANTEAYPWLAADMGRREKVAWVILHNRIESGDRLEAVTVAVGSRFNPSTIFIDRRHWKTCAYLRGPYGNGAIAPVQCPAPLVDSRFVLIYMDHKAHLSLCEVTIMVQMSG